MLIITRQEGQEAMITTRSGEEIVVRVAGVKGGRTRLAFEADPRIVIDRMEVHQAKVDAGTAPRKPQQ